MNARVNFARLLALITVAYGAALLTWGASFKHGHSLLASRINELTAAGTTAASALAWMGFVPLGLLFAGFLIAASPAAHVRETSRLGFLLLWTQPVAFIAMALAPCDPGCRLGNSFSQTVHDLINILCYFGGATAMVFLAGSPALKTRLKVVCVFAGVAWLVLFVLMLIPELSSARGLLQRMAYALLGVVLLVVAWKVVRTERVLEVHSTMRATLHGDL
jgi:hypothetical protein